MYTKTQLELESVRGRHREALTELYGLRSKVCDVCILPCMCVCSVHVCDAHTDYTAV